jgi:hypothetical protein
MGAQKLSRPRRLKLKIYGGLYNKKARSVDYCAKRETLNELPPTTKDKPPSYQTHTPAKAAAP